MSKQAYLISGYCEHTCSECGVKYTDTEYFNYYSLKKIMRYHINCKKCGAEFHEQPKRCYYSAYYPDSCNACSEQVKIEGVEYCEQQLTARKSELQSWGAYYPCPYYKPKIAIDEYKQLSFF